MATPESAGTAIAAVAQDISDDFARLLVNVLRAADRALLPVLRDALDNDRTATVRAVRGLTLRTDIREALRGAGYDDLIETTASDAVERMAEVLRKQRRVTGVRSFIMPNPQRIAALAEIGRANLLGVAEDIATALNAAVSVWSLTVRNQDDILKGLAKVLDTNFNEVQTLFDTQVSIYGRQLQAMSTEDLGPEQAYLYVGPADGRTRDWCLERYGKVYTRDEIEAMDNNQLPNPFITGGGYNCRHSFLPVVLEEYTSLVGTNKRAPNFAVNMKEIRQLRENARRADRRRLARNRTVTN